MVNWKKKKKFEKPLDFYHSRIAGKMGKVLIFIGFHVILIIVTGIQAKTNKEAANVPGTA
jgi:hypothetical protein